LGYQVLTGEILFFAQEERNFCIHGWKGTRIFLICLPFHPCIQPYLHIRRLRNWEIERSGDWEGHPGITQSPNHPITNLLCSVNHPITLTVNSVSYTRLVEPRLLLSDFLRQELGLTGTHVGCEHGVCGACTVLVDGAAVRACLLFAVQANGREVMTVEGLSSGPHPAQMHPLQTGFWEAHGLQCGYCTPGILMSLLPFLQEHPDPSEAEIREALSGNICRCTGYQKIVEAVQVGARLMREESK